MKSIFAATIPTLKDPLARDGSSVPDHYVTKYDDDVKLVAQQKKSRLEDCVTLHAGIVGASKAVDRYGETEAQEIISRHGDTKHIEVPHLRRYIDLRDYNHPTLLDREDTIKILDNPTNKYVMGAVAAMNRRKDKVIIAALGASARDVANGLVALPSGQKILNGGTNITMAKLRTGIELLNAAEADSPEEDGTQRTFVYTANQLTKLMADSTLTSSDFNTLKALQDYQVDFFMGMKWKRVEFLPKAGNIRSCYIFGKSYIGLGLGRDITNKVSERPDKNHAIQTYTEMSIGAVRIEDDGVVQIDCDETA